MTVLAKSAVRFCVSRQYAYKDVLTNSFDFELARYFIDHGVDINLSTNDGSCAIHAAAEFGDLDFLHFLVKQPKIDLDKKDVSGDTALHIAISRESRGCNDNKNFFIFVNLFETFRDFSAQQDLKNHLCNTSSKRQQFSAVRSLKAFWAKQFRNPKCFLCV